MVPAVKRVELLGIGGEGGNEPVNEGIIGKERGEG